MENFEELNAIYTGTIATGQFAKATGQEGPSSWSDDANSPSPDEEDGSSERRTSGQQIFTLSSQAEGIDKNDRPAKRRRSSIVSVAEGLMAIADNHTYNAKVKKDAIQAQKTSLIQQAIQVVKDKFSHLSSYEKYSFVKHLSREEKTAEIFVAMDSEVQEQMYQDFSFESQAGNFSAVPYSNPDQFFTAGSA